MMKALLKLWAFHAVFLFVSCQDAETGSHDGCDHICLKDTCHVKKFNNTCYYVFTDNTRTWIGNFNLCNSNSLNMTKLHKEAVQQSAFIGGFLNELNISYGWLGGESKDDNKWTFVNDKPFNLEPYSVDQRNEGSYTKCGVFEITRKGANHSQFVVNLDECNNDNHFICRFEDWRGKPSLYVSDVPANWFEARSRCMELGGDLFYLKETENITSIYKKSSFLWVGKFFIGLRHQTWKWADGDEIFHFNRKNGEPNSYSEKCISIYNDGTWNDNKCQTKLYATCQKDATNTNEQTKADVTKPASEPEGNDLSETDSQLFVTTERYNKVLRNNFNVYIPVTAIFCGLSILFAGAYLRLKCKMRRSSKSTERTTQMIQTASLPDPLYYEVNDQSRPSLLSVFRSRSTNNVPNISGKNSAIPEYLEVLPALPGRLQMSAPNLLDSYTIQQMATPVSMEQSAFLTPFGGTTHPGYMTMGGSTVNQNRRRAPIEGSGATAYPGYMEMSGSFLADKQEYTRMSLLSLDGASNYHNVPPKHEANTLKGKEEQKFQEFKIAKVI